MRYGYHLHGFRGWLGRVFMVDIYVDADGCPVRDETIRVAARHGLKTYLVCDGGIRPGRDPLVELVIVSEGADAADDWIADHIQAADICITNDIPLAARCLERGAFAIKSNGEPFTRACAREARSPAGRGPSASPTARNSSTAWKPPYKRQRGRHQVVALTSARSRPRRRNPNVRTRLACRQLGTCETSRSCAGRRRK
jgi:uncharacterized protein YaiI (UPF0178 family)